MSTDDIEEIALSALHTNLLGEHVAHEWGVGRVLVWQPSIASDKSITDMEVLRSAGLYKVQGETIQAIVGAVYNQYVSNTCFFALLLRNNLNSVHRVHPLLIGYSIRGCYHIS